MTTRNTHNVASISHGTISQLNGRKPGGNIAGQRHLFYYLALQGNKLKGPRLLL